MLMLLNTERIYLAFTYLPCQEKNSLKTAYSLGVRLTGRTQHQDLAAPFG